MVVPKILHMIKAAWESSKRFSMERSQNTKGVKSFEDVGHCLCVDENILLREDSNVAGVP